MRRLNFIILFPLLKLPNFANTDHLLQQIFRNKQKNRHQKEQKRKNSPTYTQNNHKIEPIPPFQQLHLLSNNIQTNRSPSNTKSKQHNNQTKQRNFISNILLYFVTSYTYIYLLRMKFYLVFTELTLDWAIFCFVTVWLYPFMETFLVDVAYAACAFARFY